MTVWSGCGLSQRHRIQKVLNHSAQIVTGSRRSAHASPLLQRLGWPRLDNLVIESDLAMVHKILHNCQVPKCLRDRLCYRHDVTGRVTRTTRASLLQVPRVHTEKARRFFDFRAVSHWNRAPAQVRGARTSAGCRKRARSWLSDSEN